MGKTEYSNLPPVAVVRLMCGKFALMELVDAGKPWQTPEYRIVSKTMRRDVAEKQLVERQDELYQTVGPKEGGR